MSDYLTEIEGITVDKLPIVDSMDSITHVLVSDINSNEVKQIEKVKFISDTYTIPSLTQVLDVSNISPKAIVLTFDDTVVNPDPSIPSYLKTDGSGIKIARDYSDDDYSSKSIFTQDAFGIEIEDRVIENTSQTGAFNKFKLDENGIEIKFFRGTEAEYDDDMMRPERKLLLNNGLTIVSNSSAFNSEAEYLPGGIYMSSTLNSLEIRDFFSYSTGLINLQQITQTTSATFQINNQYPSILLNCSDIVTPAKNRFFQWNLKDSLIQSDVTTLESWKTYIGKASSTSLGIVKVGSGINITPDGVISVQSAVAGVNGSIQYNDGGYLAGNDSFVYEDGDLKVYASFDKDHYSTLSYDRLIFTDDTSDSHVMFHPFGIRVDRRSIGSFSVYYPSITASTFVSFPDESGTLALISDLPTFATTITAGIVKIGAGINIDPNGVISTSIGGINKSIQYNDNGVLAGSSDFIYNDSVLTISKQEAKAELNTTELLLSINDNVGTIFNAGGNIIRWYSNGKQYSILTPNTIASNYQVTFPSQTGVIALLNDLPTFATASKAGIVKQGSGINITADGVISTILSAGGSTGSIQYNGGGYLAGNDSLVYIYNTLRVCFPTDQRYYAMLSNNGVSIRDDASGSYVDYTQTNIKKYSPSSGSYQLMYPNVTIPAIIFFPARSGTIMLDSDYATTVKAGVVRITESNGISVYPDGSIYNNLIKGAGNGQTIVGAQEAYGYLNLTSSLFSDPYKGNINIGDTININEMYKRLQIKSIVEYADNASAITAGLTIGTVYRTGDLLKIVH